MDLPDLSPLVTVNYVHSLNSVVFEPTTGTSLITAGDRLFLWRSDDVGDMLVNWREELSSDDELSHIGEQHVDDGEE
jgi:hypothetical protein